MPSDHLPIALDSIDASSGEIVASDPQLNPAMLYLAELGASNSRRCMKSKLDRCARIVGSQSMTDCPWGRMRYTDVLGILLKLEEDGASAATINCYLSALKGVALHAWKIRQLDQEEYLRIKTIRSRRTSRLPTGRALSMGESHRLLTASHRGVSEIVDVRDRAILSIMIGCGLRRAEVTGLKMDSYDAQEMSLRLIGKGNKERVVYLPPAADAVLHEWIRSFRGREEGWLFSRIYRGGKLERNRPLSESAIALILRERLASTGDKAATPHDLRRTFATRLIEDGNDLVKVQRAMGHANVQTTARYDRRSEKDQAAMAKGVRL